MLFYPYIIVLPFRTGEFIKELYLKPLGITPRKVALKLKVSPSTFSRLLNGQSRVSPEMALRLSKCLGRSPESWLAMQDIFDLWQATHRVDLDRHRTAFRYSIIPKLIRILPRINK